MDIVGQAGIHIGEHSTEISAGSVVIQMGQEFVPMDTAAGIIRDQIIEFELRVDQRLSDIERLIHYIHDKVWYRRFYRYIKGLIRKIRGI